MTTTRMVKDVVGVYTQSFVQVFLGARPLKASVKPNSRLMDHPLETGAIISDHRIILPVEIELSMILQSKDYPEAYRQIIQLYSSGTLLIVQTRSGVYKNQIIQQPPNEEDAEMYDVLSVALKLRQVQFTSAQFGILPKNPSNNSTVPRGQQQAQQSPESAAHALARASGL